MTNARNVTLTLPNSMFREIEQKRGDVSRSRFVYRLLEASLEKVAGGTVEAIPPAVPTPRVATQEEGAS